MPIEGKHFKARELACKCCGSHGVTQDLVNRLDILRELWGKPIVLSSAYRCPNHPEERDKDTVGRHVQGIAVDIKVSGGDLINFIILAASLGFKGFGIAKTFLHIDLRKQDRYSVWFYN